MHLCHLRFHNIRHGGIMSKKTKKDNQETRKPITNEDLKKVSGGARKVQQVKTIVK